MEKLVIAIGDIHGCIEEFKELLATLQYNKEYMRLVLLGDLVDRGPDSVGCVKLARELNLECIKGNHEDKHLRWRKHELKRMASGKPNPMKNLSDEKMEIQRSLSDEDFTWMEKLPLKLELFDNTWAVHGGCEPRFTLNKQLKNQIIRVRYVNEFGVAQAMGENFSQPANTKYWSEVWKGPESIVYGHCVHSLSEPRLDEYENYMCLGVDTGCVFGGKLTGAICKPLQNGKFDVEFVQVKAKEKYYHGYEE